MGIKDLLSSFSGFLRRATTVSIETIKPDDALLRRVPINPSYIKADGSVTSFAFKPRREDTDGLSVDLERLTTREKAVLDRHKFRLARLVAQVPLSLGLTCVHSPTEENPAHSLIQGNFTTSVRRQLATAARPMRV